FWISVLHKYLNLQMKKPKKRRKEMMDYREEHKGADTPFPQPAVNGPALININADQIYLDDISDDDY
ncbi:hypothetical protein HHI36_009206, partial [Cryptolaemus montrouzieri]